MEHVLFGWQIVDEIRTGELDVNWRSGKALADYLVESGRTFTTSMGKITIDPKSGQSMMDMAINRFGNGSDGRQVSCLGENVLHLRASVLCRFVFYIQRFVMASANVLRTTRS